MLYRKAPLFVVGFKILAQAVGIARLFELGKQCLCVSLARPFSSRSRTASLSFIPADAAYEVMRLSSTGSMRRLRTFFVAIDCFLIRKTGAAIVRARMSSLPDRP